MPDLNRRRGESLYPRLATVANRWNEALRIDTRFPESHDEFLDRCHGPGQSKPTPPLLHYGAGDYNCLHQDVYGEHVFPLQVAIELSRPGEDFTGGEVVLTEQRPRMQSRAEVVPLGQGDAVVFAVRHRPVWREGKSAYRVNLRHGVSRIRWASSFMMRSELAPKKVLQWEHQHDQHYGRHPIVDDVSAQVGRVHETTQEE